MKHSKFIAIICFVLACEGPIKSENDSIWMDLVDPQEMEDDEEDCLHCSELKRPEDFNKACKAAKQLSNLIANCQCHTCDACPEQCGWLDYLDQECAQGIDYYACEDFWILCEKDKP